MIFLRTAHRVKHAKCILVKEYIMILEDRIIKIEDRSIQLYITLQIARHLQIYILNLIINANTQYTNK